MLAQAALAGAIGLIASARVEGPGPAARVAAAVAADDDGQPPASPERPDPNAWIQQGLLVTRDSLDAAILGQGFFWMADPVSGERHATRDGTLKVDREGYLVHWQRGDRLLQCDGGACAPIDLAGAARHDGAPVEGFSVGRDGGIDARYADGARRHVATLAVVAFAHPRRLRRLGEHVLVPTPASGEAQADTASSVYGASHEVLDAAVYRRIFAATSR